MKQLKQEENELLAKLNMIKERLNTYSSQEMISYGKPKKRIEKTSGLIRDLLKIIIMMIN